MWLAYSAVLLGFAGLMWSADRFVAGAAAIARQLGAKPLTIGVTIVAFGTSAPEIVVAISAALRDSGALAIGNAIGSNLANLGLVLALTALIAPIPVMPGVTRRELPIVLAVTAGGALLLWDNDLGRMDGVLLLATLALVLFLLLRSRAVEPDALPAAEVPSIEEVSPLWAWSLFLIGLLVLIGSSNLLVWGASEIALAFGVSELVIGLTVIAVGTSLPELAASAVGALRGHHDIALGNVLGSNLFNLLAVMAMPALIQPPALEPEVFGRDYLAMMAVTLLLAVTVYGHRWRLLLARSEQQAFRSGHIGRLTGSALLASYIAYYYWLFSG